MAVFAWPMLGHSLDAYKQLEYLLTRNAWMTVADVDVGLGEVCIEKVWQRATTQATDEDGEWRPIQECQR